TRRCITVFSISSTKALLKNDLLVSGGPNSKNLEEVRSGRQPFVKLDVLYRRMLDQILPKFGLGKLDDKAADDLNLASHRTPIVKISGVCSVQEARVMSWPSWEIMSTCRRRQAGRDRPPQRSHGPSNRDYSERFGWIHRSAPG